MNSVLGYIAFLYYKYNNTGSNGAASCNWEAARLFYREIFKKEVIEMKKIEAIVQPSKLEELKEALAQMNVGGLTISQVMGCGKQKGFKEYYRGTEMFLSVLPKIKMELVVDDSDCDRTIKTILEYTRTGEVGDGKIFVTTIDEVIRIRTGERGAQALK
jgi:nitrogen regulatory protein P-II 1